MGKIAVTIELTESEIKKLEKLTDTELYDDGYYNDELISDAIEILIGNV